MVETQIVSMPTFVKHDDLSHVYCGDKLDYRDYEVTSCMHPFDGTPYRLIPETMSWEPAADVAWREVRAKRDELIVAFRWRIDRQRDLIDLGEAASSTLTPLLQYVQALRDIPQTQTDPFNIVWPDEPS
jgi:hypothetical protein